MARAVVKVNVEVMLSTARSGNGRHRGDLEEKFDFSQSFGDGDEGGDLEMSEARDDEREGEQGSRAADGFESVFEWL